MKLQFRLVACALAATALLAIASPEPSATGAALLASGVVLDRDSMRPLIGAQVVLGIIPDQSTCAGGAGCGHPAAPRLVGTTDASGRFSLSGNFTPGWYFLEISDGSGYAQLHAAVPLYTGGANDLGVRTIVKLLPSEVAWLARLNRDRETISFPPSPGNLVIDEYAQVQVRAYAAKVADGMIGYVDPQYEAQPGNILGLYRSVADLAMSPDEAERNWFFEKANCPHGNWKICHVRDETVHYVNLSNADNAWVGLAGSAHPLKKGLRWAGLYAYGGIVLTPRWNAVGSGSEINRI